MITRRKNKVNKNVSNILTQLNGEYIIALEFPEDLMSFIYRILLIVFISTPLFISALSCSNSSGGSAANEYILDPTNMTAASTIYTPAATCSVFSVNSTSRRYAVITQNGTQTGIAYASYDPTAGTEILKVVFYINEGSNTKPLPTTASPADVSYSSTGYLIAKYNTSPASKTAISMYRNDTTFTASFTAHLDTVTGRYTINSLSLSDSNVSFSGTMDNVVKY
jgi:hypothetical protein